jgi:hypothetical protein
MNADVMTGKLTSELHEWSRLISLEPVLSQRGRDQYDMMAPFMDKYLDILGDGYHPETNPKVSVVKQSLIQV